MTVSAADSQKQRGQTATTASVWLVLSDGGEGRAWIINALFSTRRRALEYAATVPHEVYVSERSLDLHNSWDEHRKAPAPDGIRPLTRDDLLAEGLDFEQTTVVKVGEPT